jgi:hypothetical protein
MPQPVPGTSVRVGFLPVLRLLPANEASPRAHFAVRLRAGNEGHATPDFRSPKGEGVADCRNKNIRLNLDGIDNDAFQRQAAQAVHHFWRTRDRQAARRATAGRRDQGARGAVTGGAQMDGFIELLTQVALAAGMTREQVFYRRALELPGYFRPTKEWDFLVVRDGRLLAVAETKSQVGPSFGNNFNNRTEEAMGSALDLWTAHREGAFRHSVSPWLGYLFLLEDCDASRRPVRVKEPHFSVFPEFAKASYASRYEIFCRKLLRERHYTATALLLSDRQTGRKGRFAEPDEELSLLRFVRSLHAHLRAAA